MKKFFSNEYKYANITLYFAIIITFFLIVFHNLTYGYTMSSDSLRFSKWADDLIKFNFNFLEFFSIERDFHRPHLLFFSIPVLLIALCKVIFISEWQFAFLLLNQILVFFSLIIFVKSLLICNVRPMLISITMPIIVLSVDILTWPRFILSDTIYLFFVMLSVYFVTKLIFEKKKNYFNIFLILLLLLITRPSSIPVIFSIVIFIKIIDLKILSKKKNILLFLSIILVSTSFILGLTYLFIDLYFNEIPKVRFITDMVKTGIIIHDRPDTWVNVPKNFFEILYIYFLRLVNFFNPYANTFSILHISLNVLHTFITFLSIFIWIFFFNPENKNDKFFLFIVLMSLSIATFHSFILIDYDWRYRFPIILPLIMLFPISLEMFFKKVQI